MSKLRLTNLNNRLPDSFELFVIYMPLRFGLCCGNLISEGTYFAHYKNAFVSAVGEMLIL